MRIKTTYLSLVLILVGHLSLKAQTVRNKVSLFTGAGVSLVNSDNPAAIYQSDVSFFKGNGYGPTFTLGGLYQSSPFVGFSADLNYNRWKGHQDGDDEGQRSSNTFKSHLFSLSASSIFHISSRSNLVKYYGGTDKKMIVPFFRTGLSLIRYKAASSVNDIEVKPQKDYPAMAVAIPIGVGFKLRLSEKLTIAPELSVSFPTTDLLDNTEKTGGRTGDNDKYANLTFKLFYNLVKEQRRSF